MIVTADINLRKVICPCTRVGNSGTKCFLSLRLFDNVGYTSQFPGRFPLVIYESFTFVKEFQDVTSRVRLAEWLEREPVIITLYQSEDNSNGVQVEFEHPTTSHQEVVIDTFVEKKVIGKPLAQFSGNAFEFLFSKPTIRPPKTGAKDFAVRPQLLSSRQFTSVFRVEPEVLFCTHVVVQESEKAEIERNLRPSKEQLVGRLIMAQIEQRSISSSEMFTDMIDPSICTMKELISSEPERRKKLAKRIQTVKKKCYMCELRRCYFADMDEVFKGQDVLPEQVAMECGAEDADDGAMRHFELMQSQIDVNE